VIVSQHPTSAADGPLDASAKERRAFLRYPSGRDGACRGLGNGPEDAWVGLVQDVSAGGIGLCTRRWVQVGSTLIVELLNDEKGMPPLLMARVKRALRQGDGTWLLGCELLTPLGDDCAQNLGQDRVADRGNEGPVSEQSEVDDRSWKALLSGGLRGRGIAQ
jgi:hypothetical protein